MKVLLNGKEIDIADNSTIAGLIEHKALNPDTIVVEHNLVIVRKEEWPSIVLSPADKLEIVTFVGGG
jgi:sulfur carrier protein